MIERLLTPGSIRELAMCPCVYGKDTLCLYLIGASLINVMAQPDKRLTTQKRVVCVGVVRQTQSAEFIHKNDRKI